MSTSSLPLSAQSPRPPRVATPDNAAGPVAHDGLTWTARNGFAEVLALVPASVWAEPERQPGWKRVKKNGRREVWRVLIAGRAYFVKYYSDEGFRTRVKRLFRPPPCIAEWNGGLFALRCGIPAVVPAGHAALQRNGLRWSLLVTEAVEPAGTLSEFWRQLQSDEDVRRRRRDVMQLARQVAEMIARAHQAGFEHLDMHAANLLVAPTAPGRYRTLFVDLQSARLNRPISDAAVVRNLAQLNQWFRKNSSIKDRLRFLRLYLRWRDEFEHAFPHGRPLRLSFRALVAALDVAAQRHAQRLWAQRDRRAGRRGSYFDRIRLGGGWIAQVATSVKHRSEDSRTSGLALNAEWWREVLSAPLRWFEPTPNQRAAAAEHAVKIGHSGVTRRALLAHDDGPIPVYIKRCLARSAWRRLSQLLPPSRGMRGWRMGHALLHRDLPTPRPLALLERRVGPLIRESLLMTEALPGALDLEAHLRRELPAAGGRATYRLKSALGAALVRELRRLEERHFAHRDCKASNILVLPHPALRLFWIDMDGLRLLRRPLRESERLRPLIRLHVSLLDIAGVTRTDRVRFLTRYLSGFGRTSDAWRRLWPQLVGAAARKSAAKLARREWKLKNYGRE
ncbi:Lipopolysaccharide core heptose(I) kinase RfaP [Phycisphaerae bacterium RAS1]|nr:Lipopolysaccharide core heptose(I) kinase RfaP [Phycisphaerae bacterium RAS1]